MTTATADVESAPGPSDKDLKKVVTLAREQLDLQAEIDFHAKKMAAAAEKLAVNQNVDLPAAMDAIGIAAIPLSNGALVQITTNVQASITEAHKPAAHEWLIKHKMEALIKREIKITFGRDELAWAKKFLRDLAARKKPLNHKTKEWVDPQTLKATVRRLREAAVEAKKNPDEVVPKDIFGVFVQRSALVTVPKEKAKL